MREENQGDFKGLVKTMMTLVGLLLAGYFKLNTAAEENQEKY